MSHLARNTEHSLRTLQRWVTRYRRFGLAGLSRAGRADSGKRRRISDELRRFAEGLALQKPPLGPTAIHREVQRAALANGRKPPGFHTVYNVIRAIPEPLKTLALDGNKAYREAYDLVHRRGGEPHLAGRSYPTRLVGETRRWNDGSALVNRHH